MEKIIAKKSVFDMKKFLSNLFIKIIRLYCLCFETPENYNLMIQKVLWDVI